MRKRINVTPNDLSIAVRSPLRARVQARIGRIGRMHPLSAHASREAARSRHRGLFGHVVPLARARSVLIRGTLI